MGTYCVAVVLALSLVVSLGSGANQLVGELSRLQHGVGGKVYIVDDDTLLIKDFTYDGRGPDAFFYVGKEGSRPSEQYGVIVPYPSSSDRNTTLHEFNGEDVTLKLPAVYKTSELRWLSVWCRKYSVDFGNVYFPIRSSAEDDADEGHRGAGGVFKVTAALSLLLAGIAMTMLV